MKMTKREETAFFAAGEPREEPDYMRTAMRLMQTLAPFQKELFTSLLMDFGDLVQYERRWYFRKGYRAAKKETE